MGACDGNDAERIPKMIFVVVGWVGENAFQS